MKQLVINIESGEEETQIWIEPSELPITVNDWYAATVIMLRQLAQESGWGFEATLDMVQEGVFTTKTKEI